jgi:WXG100 family type VII secretion target
MPFEIRAQDEELDQVANRFSTQAQAVASMRQKVRQRMDALEGGGWIGKGADSFYNEMNSEVLPAVERLRRALEEASEVTSRIVRMLSEAEDEASSLFKR